MKTLTLVFVLVALLAPAALAHDAELSDIQRPVDAQAQVEEEADTSALGEAVMPEEPELLEVYRKESI